MDFLNKTYQQMADVFRSMTPGARIVSALMLVTIVVCLGFLFSGQVISSKVLLLGGQRYGSKEIKQMEGAFSQAKLNDYEIDGDQIRVPKSDKYKYLDALVVNGAMPADWGDAMDEMVKNDSPWATESMRCSQERKAKEKDLGCIIASNPSIEKAKVFIGSKPSRGFRSKTVLTASVTVEPIRGKKLTTEQAASYRALVASTFAMDEKNVTVVDNINNQYFSGDPENGTGTMGDRYSNLKEKYQNDWKSRIEEVLSYIPGALVSTNVVLNEYQHHVIQTRKPDSKGTSYESVEEENSRDYNGAAPGGRPGYVANQPMGLKPTQGRGSNEKQKTRKSEEKKMVGGMAEEKELTPSTPTLVSATVTIPDHYVLKVWKTRHPVVEGEEPKTPPQNELKQIETEVNDRVKRAVAGILPEMKGVGDLQDQVTVIFLTSLIGERLPDPTTTEEALAWLDNHWTTVGMFVLVLFGLAMMRSMLKSVPAEPVEVHTARFDESPTEETFVPQEEYEGRLSSFSSRAPSLREELSHQIQEDTDSAVNILRNWIGSKN